MFILLLVVMVLHMPQFNKLYGDREEDARDAPGLARGAIPGLAGGSREGDPLAPQGLVWRGRARGVTGPRGTRPLLHCTPPPAPTRDGADDAADATRVQ